MTSAEKGGRLDRGAAVIEQTLRDAADAFHKILAAHSAQRLLDRDGAKMPQPMYDEFITRLLEPAQVERICADGFEHCVRALAAIGAADVTIHECGERDLEKYG